MKTYEHCPAYSTLLHTNSHAYSTMFTESHLNTNNKSELCVKMFLKRFSKFSTWKGNQSEVGYIHEIQL